jgi:Mn2+/Fe2+ NRAMP family transporter
VAEHAVGFAAAWLAFGLVAAPVADAAGAVLGPVLAFALLLAGAVGWQLSLARLRLMERCGRVPVTPPRGWRAETRTAANGLSRGAGCVRTCWAPMLAMAAAPHLALMGAVAAANLAEWAPGADPFPRKRRRRPALAYAALAVLALALAAAGWAAR